MHLQVEVEGDRPFLVGLEVGVPVVVEGVEVDGAAALRLGLPGLVVFRVGALAGVHLALVHHFAQLPDRTLWAHDGDAHAVVAHIDPALGAEEVVVAARNASALRRHTGIADADADGGVGDLEGEGEVVRALVALGRYTDGILQMVFACTGMR